MRENDMIDHENCETNIATVNYTVQIIGACVTAGSAVVLFYIILGGSGLLWKLGSSIAAIIAGHSAKRKVKTKSLSIPKSIIAFSLIAGYASLGFFLIVILLIGATMIK
jgi:hypothetical protein